MTMVTFCHVTKSDTGTKKVSHHHNSSSLGLGVKHGFKESVQCSPGRYELSLLLHQGTSCVDKSCFHILLLAILVVYGISLRAKK